MFKTCEFCSATEEIEAGAEAAERRKCEKCVNHHKAVCNKREKGKGKNICHILEICAKSFRKTEKRERQIYRLLFGIKPVAGFEAGKNGKNKMGEKEPENLCSFSCGATGKRDTPPLKCVKNYDMICKKMKR